MPRATVSFEGVEVVAVTGKALLVRIPDADDREEWIPLSQIDLDETTVIKQGDVGTITMTEWIAQQKDLL